jgi:hypothetical protein
MKLPNLELAEVPERKITHYLLNPALQSSRVTLRQKASRFEHEQAEETENERVGKKLILQVYAVCHGQGT